MSWNIPNGTFDGVSPRVLLLCASLVDKMRVTVILPDGEEKHASMEPDDTVHTTEMNLARVQPLCFCFRYSLSSAGPARHI